MFECGTFRITTLRLLLVDLHPTQYDEIKNVKTAAQTQIVRLENRMDNEITALKKENSKGNYEYTKYSYHVNTFSNLID